MELKIKVIQYIVGEDMAYNVNHGRKNRYSLKEKHQMEKMVYANRSQLVRTVDLNHYKCPNCGKFMRTQLADYDTSGNTFIIVCDACNLVGTARRERNGKILLKSVPADKKTRNLRAEAHYYFDILYKDGIFVSREQAYLWLSEQLFACDMGIRHIGEMNAEQCIRAIDKCRKCLEENKHRLHSPLVPYGRQQGN